MSGGRAKVSWSNPAGQSKATPYVGIAYLPAGSPAQAELGDAADDGVGDGLPDRAPDAVGVSPPALGDPHAAVAVINRPAAKPRSRTDLQVIARVIRRYRPRSTTVRRRR